MKSYECPECKAVHTEKEWDKCTEKFYGIGEIVPIVEAGIYETYFCPSCDEESCFSEIYNNTEMVTITREEYEELLEIKEVYENTILRLQCL